MDDVLQDIRYALRLCLRTPGFTAIAVLALALGIGANTAIFTIVNAVLLEPLPFRDPGRLVVMWETNARRPGRPNVLGAGELPPLAGARDGVRADGAVLRLPRQPHRHRRARGARRAWTSRPTSSRRSASRRCVGRTFADDEGPEGHDAVAVLSYGLWQRRFAGDAGIVGRTIQLNGRPITVIGVMPADMRLFLKRGSLTGKPADLWMPFAFTRGAAARRAAAT